MNKKIIWLVFVVVIATGAIWYFANQSELTSSDAATREECLANCKKTYDATVVDCDASYGPDAPARNNIQHKKCLSDALNAYNDCVKRCPAAGVAPINMMIEVEGGAGVTAPVAPIVAPRQSPTAPRR